jgi:hypothetical protein
MAFFLPMPRLRQASRKMITNQELLLYMSVRQEKSLRTICHKISLQEKKQLLYGKYDQKSLSQEVSNYTKRQKALSRASREVATFSRLRLLGTEPTLQSEQGRKT